MTTAIMTAGAGGIRGSAASDPCSMSLSCRCSLQHDVSEPIDELSTCYRVALEDRRDVAVQRPFVIIAESLGRQDHDRYRSRLLSAPHLLHHLEAADAGHHEAHENQVWQA